MLAYVLMFGMLGTVAVLMFIWHRQDKRERMAWAREMERYVERHKNRRD